MKYYPIVRFRDILTQDYIEEKVCDGAPWFASFEEANKALGRMDVDDSDYEVCFNDGSTWRATRDGLTALDRSIP